MSRNGLIVLGVLACIPLGGCKLFEKKAAEEGQSGGDSMAIAASPTPTASAAASSVQPSPSPSASVSISNCVAPAAAAHVVYVNAANKVIYATNASGCWATEEVADGGEPAMAIDSASVPHVAFYSIGGIYSKKRVSAGVWKSENGAANANVVVSNGNAVHPAVAFDSAGRFHVAYSIVGGAAAGKLQIARYNSGSATYDIADLDNTTLKSAYVSIAIDSIDKIHAAYAPYLLGSTQNMKYVSGLFGAVGGFQVGQNPPAPQNIDPVTAQTPSGLQRLVSIAVDGSNVPYVAYAGTTGDDFLYVANRSGGVWTATQLMSSDISGNYPSLLLDSNGKVHLSHSRRVGTSYTGHYVTNASGSYVTAENASTQFSGSAASAIQSFTAIALDSANRVSVAWHDDTSNAIKFATNASGSWGVTVIDANGTTTNPGDLISIAISGQKGRSHF